MAITVPHQIRKLPSKIQLRNRRKTLRGFLDRIPIAGLHNFLYADNKTEKRLWALALVVSLGATLYYFVPCIMNFVEFDTVVDKRTIETEIPFPPMHICLNGGVNKTYMWDNFLMKIWLDLEKHPRIHRFCKGYHISMETLAYELLGYLTYAPFFEKPWFNEKMAPAFNDIINLGISELKKKNQWHGIKHFYEKGRYKCDQVLKECRMNGQPFPCCAKDQNDGISSAMTTCYKLNVPPDMKMVKPGKASQLRIRTSIDRKHFLDQLWEMAAIGIEFSENLMGLYGIPHFIHAGTVTKLHVIVKKRESLNGCTKQFKYDPKNHLETHPLLQRYMQSMEEPNEYSVERCMQAILLDHMYPFCGCVPDYDTLAPNDDAICTPAHLYACFNRAFRGIQNVSTMDGKVHDMMDSLRDRSKGECKPLCDTWDYDTTETFAPLFGKRGDITNVIQNEIIISVDPEYTLEKDVWKIDFIAFFASIGDGLALFLGLSAVSLVQAFVWVLGAACLIRGRRRVHPVTEVKMIVVKPMAADA